MNTENTQGYLETAEKLLQDLRETRESLDGSRDPLAKECVEELIRQEAGIRETIEGYARLNESERQLFSAVALERMKSLRIGFAAAKAGTYYSR